MKVQVTIEQDYCPFDHDCLGCCERDVTFEADIPDGLIGPISKPRCVGVSIGQDLEWEGIRPLEKRDMFFMLLEDLTAEMWRQMHMRHA
jgi:hypothetical protein